MLKVFDGWRTTDVRRQVIKNTYSDTVKWVTKVQCISFNTDIYRAILWSKFLSFFSVMLNYTLSIIFSMKIHPVYHLKTTLIAFKRSNILSPQKHGNNSIWPLQNKLDTYNHGLILDC